MFENSAPGQLQNAESVINSRVNLESVVIRPLFRERKGVSLMRAYPLQHTLIYGL